MASRSAAAGPRPHTGRLQLALATLGALSVLPPYIGPPLGLELDVKASVEVVDHVVPGIVIAVCAGFGALLARRGGELSIASMALSACCFLAALWQAVTHVPLVLQGGDPGAPWDSVLLHSTAGPLLVVIALWLTLRASASEGPQEAPTARA